MGTNKKYADVITQNKTEFLKFLKSKFQLFHLSNVFLRDIQYGICEYYTERQIALRYDEAENIAFEVIAFLEKENIVKRLNERTWLLNYPEFKLAPVRLVPTLQPSVKQAIGTS